MSHNSNCTCGSQIEWISSTDTGYAGRTARVTIVESHPPGISWKATAEELVPVVGTNYLRPSGWKLSEGSPTRDAAKANAVLLVRRLKEGVAA